MSLGPPQCTCDGDSLKQRLGEPCPLHGLLGKNAVEDLLTSVETERKAKEKAEAFIITLQEEGRKERAACAMWKAHVEDLVRLAAPQTTNDHVNVDVAKASLLRRDEIGSGFLQRLQIIEENEVKLRKRAVLLEEALGEIEACPGSIDKVELLQFLEFCRTRARDALMGKSSK